MRQARFAIFVLYLLSASAALSAGPSRSQRLVSEFAQRFYDWYAPVAHKSGDAPSCMSALNERGAEFDAQLNRALREDVEAQRRSPGDLVGLDFDPFLNSQDPRDKYMVGNVTETDGVFLVDVHGVQDGNRAADPDVVAEIRASNGSFIFTNFRYGPDGNLVDILKLLAEQRAHPPQ
jgi:hypothetical protein